MKKYSAVLTLILFLSGCLPRVPVLIKSDQNEVSFYIKPMDKSAQDIFVSKGFGKPNPQGEYFLGRGQEVQARFYQIVVSDKHLGRFLLIGRKEGFPDRQVLIQPNKKNTFTPGMHFFIWTIGWICLDPLYIYWLNHDSWYYGTEEGQKQIEMKISLNTKAEQ